MTSDRVTRSEVGGDVAARVGESRTALKYKDGPLGGDLNKREIV